MVIGEKVMLRAWSTKDLTTLQLMRNDIHLQRQLMARPRGNSADQIKDWLETRTKSADGLFFVIASKATDMAAGYVQVVGMDFINGLGRLGICIAPEMHGQGYGGEAIRLLEGYLWNVFHLRKLTQKVLAENFIAIGMYLKIGYREVGRLREHFCMGDRYEDAIVMEKMIFP